MRRIDTIMAIMTAITNLVKEAYYVRNDNPHRFKLRNHYISEALGLHMSLCILGAYPYEILDTLKIAIENYDIYLVQHIANSEKKYARINTSGQTFVFHLPQESEVTDND